MGSGDDDGAKYTHSRAGDAYATKEELSLLASQLKSVSENFRALTDQVSESSKTLKQILIWLRGSTNEDGEFEPGLIEQNKRQQVVIKRAVKWEIGRAHV